MRLHFPQYTKLQKKIHRGRQDKYMEVNRGRLEHRQTGTVDIDTAPHRHKYMDIRQTDLIVKLRRAARLHTAIIRADFVNS